ncbi:Uncharacterised protein r2_g700 [Pycnogonum litorale]
MSGMRPDTIHKVTVNSRQESSRFQDRNLLKSCLYCGRSHRRRKEDCPAWGQTCSRCHLKNHFAVKCKTSDDVHQVTTEDRDQERGSDSPPTFDTVFSMRSSIATRSAIKCELLVRSKATIFQIDTGSSANMIPRRLATNIIPTDTVLRMWNGTALKPAGLCTTTVLNKRDGCEYEVNFTVYDGDFMPILGLETSIAMGLIEVNERRFIRVHHVTELHNFSDVFDNQLGTLPGVHSLTVSDSVTPVTMPARRVPIALRPKLKAEVDRLTDLGVLAPVTEPTPWLSQIVVVAKKSENIRLCLDLFELNKALVRERYTLPVLEDTLHDMRNSKVFSKADLAAGYW